MEFNSYKFNSYKVKAYRMRNGSREDGYFSDVVKKESVSMKHLKCNLYIRQAFEEAYYSAKG